MPTAAGIYYAQFDEGHGDQPPVILIHGAGSSHLIWPAALRRIGGQRVLAVDLPGHGRSGGVALQSIQAYASQMIEFLAALGLYQAIFVGHSMGGAIALEVAAANPTHVAGLGLIATGAYLGVDAGFLENLSNPVTTPSAIASFQMRAFGPQAAPLLIDRCMQTMHETRGAVLYGDWLACSRFDLRELIARIEAPAWVIAGNDDRLIPIAYAHFLADRLPAARLQVILNAGHMVIVEQPEKVAAGLQQFLAALTAARVSATRVRLPAAAPVNTFQKKTA